VDTATPPVSAATRRIRELIARDECVLLDGATGTELRGRAGLRPGAEEPLWATRALVDAPCSGTGTWRRNPETRWRLTRERLDALVTLQAYLLEVASELVRPGGFLVYAVCSLLAEEGRDQAEQDGTDGFFVARWRAPC